MTIHYPSHGEYEDKYTVCVAEEDVDECVRVEVDGEGNAKPVTHGDFDGLTTFQAKAGEEVIVFEGGFEDLTTDAIPDTDTSPLA